MDSVDFHRIDTNELSKDEVAELMRAIAKSLSPDKRVQIINAYNAFDKAQHKNSKND